VGGGGVPQTSHRVRTPEYLELAPGTRPVLALPADDGVAEVCGIEDAR
jgi:hypothetical protein